MRGLTRLGATTIAVLLSTSAAEAQRHAFKHEQTVLRGPKGRPLSRPEGVACRGREQLIIGDSGNRRLIAYRYHNRELSVTKVIALPQRIIPVRVEYSPKGRIYVLDGRGTRRIARFDDKGRFGGFVRLKGSPLVNKVALASFKINRKGKLYLLDLARHNVLVTSLSGTFSRAIALPPEERVFTDLAAADDGAVYAVTGSGAKLYVAGPSDKSFKLLTKNLSPRIAFASHLSLDAKEKLLFVVDQHGDRVALVHVGGQLLARKLARGWREGLVHFPAQLCSTDDGHVLLADRNNNRVQLFSPGR